ncbi:hypothetical protein RJZ56_000313 [Blastomyces dermatitidis]|uniref:DUF202 domain-containing protein n=3 Tax=Blastomyces TaxID=229219 RepID=A0A179UCM5_BLAGS|nr:uncharacterized protein BDBG_01873 [Blastomyces gilchristii SLH14081]XP_045275668.1 uncharacterized protein BDCG_03689 [Blastomyces dermatitidis ER-3]EGE77261.1 hypothetical protein BDDG_00198 [Blastomyces dermatitidis ATCC 18188]EQL38657.1 hypothetical protein BDFG_00215 [Blastomyces dermatitidis ATCC 26199]EEQ88569.1 hypothetical protein BDCG_03689 [Blastomyces dermatitidis ER-3]OAT05483.1 hypothetical protein BDBG_01873 [Blastomyces gilchristii SLH14081]
MASLQSSLRNNTTSKDSNNTIDIAPNHDPGNSTSTSLATARKDEAIRSRSRPRLSSPFSNTNPHHDVVEPTGPADSDGHHIAASPTVAATAPVDNYDQSYQDATELVDLPPVPVSDHSDEDNRDNARNPNSLSRSSSISTISSGSVRLVVQRTLSTQQSNSRAGDSAAGSGTNNKGILAGVKRFWFQHVSMTVPRSQNRDHFALERTFLAYIRTSLAFAFQGALIAQLFSLQNKQDKNIAFGFHTVGRPLACACHACAIIVAAMGSYRFWRQQNALARGKVQAGGWELNLAGVCAVGIITSTFVLVILIATRSED